MKMFRTAVMSTAVFVMSCQVPVAEPVSKADLISLKTEIQTLTGLKKFTHDQHVLLKKYFSHFLSKKDWTTEDCEWMALAPDQIESILQSCDQGGYFVCAEEVRLYQERHICKS